ncbi:MAG: hypothetical protein U1F65_02515 [Verrucomicrobiota bacterium]
MGLHFWLIPLGAICVAGVATLYLIIHNSGGSGERSEGRTLFDDPAPSEEPKGEWNFYGKP